MLQGKELEGEKYLMGKQWENAYRTTMVCIDEEEQGNLCGRLYNPYIPEGEEFHSIMEFLLIMERLLDEMKFPQSFEAVRAFREPPILPAGAVTGTRPDTDVEKGKRCTFAVRVLFRQNASWQGSITWLEGQREESFRSVLELLLLMNSAVSDK